MTITHGDLHIELENIEKKLIELSKQAETFDDKVMQNLLSEAIMKVLDVNIHVCDNMFENSTPYTGNEEGEKIVEKLSFTELQRNKDWKEAVIVFHQDSFEREFTETERSYKISSDAKYFNGMMGGNSLFGNCLDGKDNGVRLDIYMKLQPNEGKRWIAEYCYITKMKEEKSDVL
jgi:hypothetical protein